MKVTLKLFYKYVIPSIENAVTVCQLSQRKKKSLRVALARVCAGGQAAEQKVGKKVIRVDTGTGC